ncbi:hypothetical protein ACFRQM_09260 [Streptomyces sp. NPDC056831]|uniref:hypothetical protein n=1 Tax=Streptomyces sp. NPDC056831 TaxID=3345954 RepID=UPI00367C5314
MTTSGAAHHGAQPRRARIAASVVAKCLDPVAAGTRVREHAARVKELAWNGDELAALRATRCPLRPATVI